MLLRRFFAIAATMLVVPSLVAGQSIDDIDAEWDNEVPTAVTVDNSNPDNILACWTGGSPANCNDVGTSRSGYGFERTSTPFGVTAGTPFELGIFTHYNVPITLGDQLQSIQLNLDYNVSGTTVSDSWTLFHEETSNTAPCAYPGGSPCADRVTFQLTSGAAPTPFMFNGQMYQITLLGFGNAPGGADLAPEFITFENQENSTILWAQVELVPGSTVPEPATMTLLATGLVGMAAARRRRTK